MYQEDSTLHIVEVVQVRAQLETPRAPQYSVDDDCRIVELFGVKPAMPTQAIWVVRMHSLSFAEQEREIPIAGEVPPKRVRRVYKDCDKPQAEEGGFGHAVF